MADMNGAEHCIGILYDQEEIILGATVHPDTAAPWTWSEVDWQKSAALLDPKAVGVILCLAGLPDPPDGSRIIVKVDVAAGTVEIS
jgi:hypothetical protein